MEDVYDKNKYFTFIRFQILELTNVIEKCLSIFHILFIFWMSLSSFKLRHKRLFECLKDLCM